MMEDQHSENGALQFDYPISYDPIILFM